MLPLLLPKWVKPEKFDRFHLFYEWSIRLENADKYLDDLLNAELSRRTTVASIAA